MRLQHKSRLRLKEAHQVGRQRVLVVARIKSSSRLANCSSRAVSCDFSVIARPGCGVMRQAGQDAERDD